MMLLTVSVIHAQNSEKLKRNIVLISIWRDSTERKIKALWKKLILKYYCHLKNKMKQEKNFGYLFKRDTLTLS